MCAIWCDLLVTEVQAVPLAVALSLYFGQRSRAQLYSQIPELCWLAGWLAGYKKVHSVWQSSVAASQGPADVWGRSCAPSGVICSVTEVQAVPLTSVPLPSIWVRVQEHSSAFKHQSL